MSECVCPEPEEGKSFWCPRYGEWRGKARWRLCRNSPAHRAMWDASLYGIEYYEPDVRGRFLLGDVISSITKKLGIRECGGCLARRSWLNRMTNRPGLSWGVAVTTAPRKDSLLKRCIYSIVRAGWPSVHIFAEPGTEIDSELMRFCRVTRHRERRGAWMNWYGSLKWMVENLPDADVYLMVQDDVVFCDNARLLCEDFMWPDQKGGIAALCRSAVYRCPKMGVWMKIPVNPRGIAGAWAIALAADIARDLVRSKIATGWQLNRRPEHRKWIDGFLGRYIASAGVALWAPCPSLAQHMSAWEVHRGIRPNRGASTLKHTQARANMIAPDFPGEGVDCISVWRTFQNAASSPND